MDGVSYSEYRNDNFKCGQFKLLCEVNGEDCTGKRYRVPSEEEEEGEEITPVEEEETSPNDIEVDLRDSDSDFASFSFDAETPSQYYCGATIISDRSLG